MSRWLVTLALAVVAMPDPAAAASPGLRVEHAKRSVTTSRALAARALAPRIARLPATVELERGAVSVETEAGFRIRHRLAGESESVSWIATVGAHVVIGYAAHAGGHADSVIAIDHVTGKLAWRRSIDSLAAVELAGTLLAIERAGALDVVDTRTGATLGTTPLLGQGIQSLSRSAGDLHIKTHGDLIAIDGTTGAIRWVQPSTSVGNTAATPGAVVDAWVDRSTHRFGIVRYDARDGHRLDSIDLGTTSGWYDHERVDLAPDGPTDVLVSALFAIT